MGDHFIPQFLLRKFSINPTVNKKNQRIKILEDGIVTTKRISESFQFEDFYYRETEDSLARFEYDISEIHRKIIEDIAKGEKELRLSKNDYIMLARFSVIMWRRNNSQIEKMNEQFELLFKITPKDFLKKEFQNMNIDELLNSNSDSNRKNLFELTITLTTENDPTVSKTLYCYQPLLLVNESPIAFPLHNLFSSSVNYYDKDGKMINNPEYPSLLIEPISRNIYLLLFLANHKLDDELKISIERESNSEKIKQIIDWYLVSNQSSIVVDDSNLQLIQDILFERDRIHHMTLWDEPFDLIKNGTKTIEMRLYDEKRRKISIGDSIQFIRKSDSNRLFVKVTALHIKRNFHELYESFKKEELGYKPDEIASPDDMFEYYSQEQINKYGILGIQIKLNE